MAFAQVGSATHEDSSNATDCTPAVPTGVAANDLAFGLVCRYYGGDATLADPSTVPTGFQLIGKHQFVLSGLYTFGFWLYYKLLTGSDSGTYQWIFADSMKISGCVAAFRDGFNTADIIDAYSNTQYNTTNTTLRGAGVTVSAANSPLLLIGGTYLSAARTFTPPDGWTEAADIGSGVADYYNHMSFVIAGAGATGDKDATMNDTATGKHAFLVALNPLVVAPTLSAEQTGSTITVTWS